MSHPINSQWLEAAQENFETAIEQGDYQAVLDVIEDTREAGFEGEAKQMELILKETPVSKFHKTYTIDELLAHLSKHTGI